MNERDLLAELEAIVGPGAVLRDPQALADYGRDAIRDRRWAPEGGGLPLAVVRPGSTEQVAGVLRLATRARVPVVPYGGGTGVMGGATSLQPGIVLDMGAMNRVLDVSIENRAARVQPGVVLAELDEVAHGGGLFLAHDPWSQPVATVGGAISTNGVGYLAAKYGPMGRQVLALEAVLPTGEVVRTPALPREVSAGVDLGRLFVGAEGTFGVITEATVRLYPMPEERRHYALAFPSFQGGFFAICRLFAEGLQPAMVDFAEEDEEDGPPIEADAPNRSVLHLSLEGLPGEVDAQEGRAWEIITTYGGRDLGPEEARAFWEERHASGERYLQERRHGRRHPWQDGGRAYAYIHTAVPISHVLDLRYRAIVRLQREGLRVREVAIWGEPEMFSIVADGASDDGGLQERARQASDEILDMALEMGGTVEYCHGVGVRLRHVYGRELGEGGLALLRRLKSAVDPAGIMNPGKLVD